MKIPIPGKTLIATAQNSRGLLGTSPAKAAPAMSGREISHPLVACWGPGCDSVRDSASGEVENICRCFERVATGATIHMMFPAQRMGDQNV